MPCKEIDYSKTIIYKLVCKNIKITELYVGYTTHFTQRKSKHKHSCNNPKNEKYNFKVYTFIRENGGWDNWDMIMIEEFPCRNVLEATKQERLRTEELQSTLNTYCPTQTNIEYINKQIEYRIENRDKLNQASRDYYQENKETILEKQKIRITCECGSTIRKDDISKHKKTQKHINYIKSTA